MNDESGLVTKRLVTNIINKRSFKGNIVSAEMFKQGYLVGEPLTCRPFVVITTLSTDLVGIEVTSVSWCCFCPVGLSL